MLEKIYFWKVRRGYNVPVTATAAIVASLFIIAIGAFAWWYYGVNVPAHEKRVAQQQALRKKQADLVAIASFYKKSLAGEDILQAINVLGEIRQNTLTLSALGVAIKKRNFICDTKACAVGFKIEQGTILTLPVINFFGQPYPASVPIRRDKERAPANDFEYSRLALPVTKNNLFRQWSRKQALSLHSCNEIITYVNTYNSLLSTEKRNKPQRDGIILFKSYPASAVKDKEAALAGHLSFRGLMSASWEMQIGNGSDRFSASAPEIDAQLALYKQAYRDAFLIKKIESNDKGIRISGGLVCKA
ncbi:hypothetical protein LMA04_09945 [Pseudescherichia vulneris]|uniref:hypothetical protein n=1 Tax=Pseudescherichia vulneris TaxID=566 RepID=UPI00227D6C5A|nr:hypothetical protein [Pseudescherichia vulneris]WAH54304.1 hypothetical protein LMA04_09945 [Pseudescherichia vulneris]